MRILLAQNSLYYPAHGGGDKSNRLLLEALAAKGHDCQVVARVHTRFGEAEHRRYLRELAMRRVEGVSAANGVVQFPHHGVEVHAVTSHPNFRQYFADRIHAFQPRVIILSTDDAAQILLEVAVGPNPARVIYLTRTTLALPFGPEGAFPSKEKTERLRKADGVAGVSEYVARYIRQYSGINAVALPISLLLPGPWPGLGSHDNEFITLVNPCAVKGISIFLALAAEMPELQFAAVPTWGTNKEDIAALRRHPNIHVLDPVDDIDDLLMRTRIMLVPSLWAEARSRIIVEAMLRGIPVLASDVGGIPEAKMGVPYLIPVKQIERYRPQVDDQMVPVAEVPEQDIEPWVKALRELLASRESYDALSKQSRDAATDYASNLSIRPFEEYLEEVVQRPRNPLREWAKTQRTEASPASGVDSLSPAKRALLALRLKKRGISSPQSQDLWFPNISQTASARMRLFCFPYAGGGAAVFRNWQDKMPAGVAVVPARLPGRESRTREAPIGNIDALADAVAEAIHPYLDKPFALFGHSMGAMISFELTRYLRRHDLPLPLGLLVAAGRAPQFRRNHVPAPPPTDEEFLRELRDLEGLPKEALENESLLKHLLPALKADSTLGRLYVYEDEPPLDIPIRAYVGAGDPRLPREVIEAWKEQTTASFRMREFPGGHFFLHTAEDELLNSLAADLSEIAPA